MQELTEKELRVLIVDDHSHFIDALTFVLQEVEGYEFALIDKAATGREAVDKVNEEPYDVIFMDIEMPDMDGVEATTKITQAYRGVHIIVMSFHSQLEKVIQLVNCGARNYIVKDRVTKETIESALDKIYK